MVEVRQRGVADVYVEIDVPARDADGILVDKPLEAGMVVARPVVVEAGEAVVLPARELEWIRETRIRCQRGAEGGVAVLRCRIP